MGEREALEWAKGREGLLTRAEAMQFGVRPHQLRHRVRAGKMHRPLPSVYRAGGAPHSYRSRVLAGVLWAEKESRTIPRSRIIVSHGSAARLHGFPGYEEHFTVHLTMTRLLDDRRERVKVHLKRKAEFDLTTYEVTRSIDSNFAVTTPARTLLDIANEAKERELEAIIDYCLREKLVTLVDLRELLVRGRKRRGICKLRPLIFHRIGQPTPRSKLEQLAMELILGAGLPPPSEQVPVELDDKRYRLDLVYRAQGVVIECDGYAWHADAKSFEADRERHNSIIAKGGLLLRWTWKGVHERPDELVKELRAALALRGGS